MARIVFSAAADPAFVELTRILDAGLAVIDGDQAPFFAQYNKIDGLPCVVMAYEGETAVGCGAYKEYEPGTAEIKRMFVREEHRRKGVAADILDALEKHAKGSGFRAAILETGNKMQAAIGLYEGAGYRTIPAYGPYVGVESSMCMKKELT